MRSALCAIVLAGCASPAASSLAPQVHATPEVSRLTINVYFDAADPDVAIDATFRGKTVHVLHDGAGSYFGFIPLDSAVATDEVLDVNVDGVAMTMMAPAAFDTVDAPLFVSRTQDATATWSPATPEPIHWGLLSSNCVRSNGGDLPANTASLTFHATDWTPDPSEPDATCTTDIVLMRERTTAIDPAFAGGELLFWRGADLKFASTP